MMQTFGFGRNWANGIFRRSSCIGIHSGPTQFPFVQFHLESKRLRASTQFASVLFVCISVLGVISSAWAEDVIPFDINIDVAKLPKTALIETEKGAFEIAFYVEQSPVTVRNFEHLSKKGFYNKLSFHRYVPGFVIQGGDPLGTGKGGPGYSLPPEYSSIKHVKGTVGMARLPGEVNLERKSNGSQFYITLAPSPHLDGRYTVFAQVIKGMNVVESLREGDRIIRVRLPRP
jgi:peptidyl-prolyl cis-trans isomerase B (cyclophilin B)